AMSCYGSRINSTPNIDRIANEGLRIDNCFCTNSICAPSRATILTGKYNHLNGVRTLDESMDGRQQTFPKLIQQSGYQTAMIGKWHLGHGGNFDPTGFDYWNVLLGQGEYHNPNFIEMGENIKLQGYATDIITDISLDWLKRREKDRPFMLMCHHKAPHRPWEPDDKHMHMYDDLEIQEPESFNDDYSGHTAAARAARMRIEELTPTDTKVPAPKDLNTAENKKWKYQRYIKDYLRCIASIDDNVGRLLDYLDAEGLAENTIVIYTSDQGFFLGDHGWFDKRFMYEESLRMPFVVRYPAEIKPGTVTDSMALNVDFAETFLDYAGIDIPGDMQGFSLRPIFNALTPAGWRTSVYYRYWMHKDSSHKVYSHYGIRTHQYKLIYYYADKLDTPGPFFPETSAIPGGPEIPEWEFFDLEKDPLEMHSLYNNPEYAEIIRELKKELQKQKDEVKDFA
ncbi:MAG: sulfatase, partial [Eubacteriales bacterium]